ncbi:MAG TPA: hypothetical protein VHF01_09325 [Candidatus Acidoferrum sp.]|nr:hypothetical protein [Candidatus Acidoferrum sp.]
MQNWLTIALALILFTDADLPRVNDLRPRTGRVEPFFAGEEIPVFPNTVPSEGEAQAQLQAANQTQGETPKGAQNGAKKIPLGDESKLKLIRYVSGEFGKAVKPLPAGKDGFLVYVGKSINQELLDRAVATHGAAVNTGDSVQITKLEFREHMIVVDLNGGGRGKRRWRDHLQIGLGGGMPPMQTTTTREQSGPPGIQPGRGSTIFLEFTKVIPDLSPEDLKKLLAPFLDFSKQRSAAVQWFDTLPPEMKKAIEDRRPAMGMDREEVVAAIGKPDHKVRERDTDGVDIEDWIYGQPPSKTVFVRFSGDHVTSIKQFPQ